MTDDVSGFFSQGNEDQRALELVAALQKTRTLNKRATVIYRCQSRNCAMLYVFVAHGQTVLHQPPYKLSDDVNRRETVSAARARHTRDGDRRWQPSTFLLVQAAGQLSLECDHCRAKVSIDSVAADAAAATRQPTEIKLANNAVR